MYRNLETTFTVLSKKDLYREKNYAYNFNQLSMPREYKKVCTRNDIVEQTLYALVMTWFSEK